MYLEIAPHLRFLLFCRLLRLMFFSLSPSSGPFSFFVRIFLFMLHILCLFGGSYHLRLFAPRFGCFFFSTACFFRGGKWGGAASWVSSCWFWYSPSCSLGFFPCFWVFSSASCFHPSFSLAKHSILAVFLFGCFVGHDLLLVLLCFDFALSSGHVPLSPGHDQPPTPPPRPKRDHNQQDGKTMLIKNVVRKVYMSAGREQEKTELRGAWNVRSVEGNNKKTSHKNEENNLCAMVLKLSTSQYCVCVWKFSKHHV